MRVFIKIAMDAIQLLSFALNVQLQVIDQSQNYCVKHLRFTEVLNAAVLKFFLPPKKAIE